MLEGAGAVVVPESESSELELESSELELAANEILVAFPDAAVAVPLVSPLVAVTVAPDAAHVDSTRADHWPDASAVAVAHVVPPEDTVTVAPAPASLP